MATIKTKPITTAQFDSLMELLPDYFCTGWSRNINAESGDDWDTLHFKYDGSANLGLEFTLAHPLTPPDYQIDHNIIEVRFGVLYPFEQDWKFVVSDPTQVKLLKEAVREPYRQYREFGVVHGQRLKHANGSYIGA